MQCYRYLLALLLLLVSGFSSIALAELANNGTNTKIALEAFYCDDLLVGVIELRIPNQ